MTSRIEIKKPSHDRNHPPCASLLGIPGELRNHIYEFLFPNPDKDTTKLNTLLTCRQVYHEAAILAFKSRRFIINTVAGRNLANKLSFLSDEQKSLIKVIERPGLWRRGLCFYLAIEKHLRPSCLITETSDGLNLLSAIVRIDSLTQVFTYSKNGDSMNRLIKVNDDMRTYHCHTVDAVKRILDMQGHHLNNDVALTTDNCVMVGILYSGSKSFSVNIGSGAQKRSVMVSVPRYSLSHGTWDTEISP